MTRTIGKRLTDDDAYEAKIRKSRDAITSELVEKVGVDITIAKDLKGRIFPATHKPSIELPNGEEWLNPMLNLILDHINPGNQNLLQKEHSRSSLSIDGTYFDESKFTTVVPQSTHSYSSLQHIICSYA